MSAVSDAERFETVVVGGQAGLFCRLPSRPARSQLVILDAKERSATRGGSGGLAPALHAGAIQRARRHAVPRPATFLLHQG